MYAQICKIFRILALQFFESQFMVQLNLERYTLTFTMTSPSFSHKSWAHFMGCHVTLPLLFVYRYLLLYFGSCIIHLNIKVHCVDLYHWHINGNMISMLWRQGCSVCLIKINKEWCICSAQWRQIQLPDTLLHPGNCWASRYKCKHYFSVCQLLIDALFTNTL